VWMLRSYVGPKCHHLVQNGTYIIINEIFYLVFKKHPLSEVYIELFHLVYDN